MADRRNEKERLRREREEAERRTHAETRKRLVLGYAVAALLAAAVIGGVIFAVASGGGGGKDVGKSVNTGDEKGDGGSNVNTDFGGIVPDGVRIDNRSGTPPPEIVTGDLATAAKTAGCELQLDLPEEGNTHVDPPTPESLPKYDTNPPSSGDHYPVPLADGAFLDTPPVGNFVHTLEHGRIEIQYSPDLSEEDQLALKGVFDSDRGGMILFPNPDMPYEVATTAWTELMGCKTFDGDATLDAIRDFRDEYRGRAPEPFPF
jgi:hypothetical protein